MYTMGLINYGPPRNSSTELPLATLRARQASTRYLSHSTFIRSRSELQDNYTTRYLVSFGATAFRELRRYTHSSKCV